MIENTPNMTLKKDLLNNKIPESKIKKIHKILKHNRVKKQLKYFKKNVL